MISVIVKVIPRPEVVLRIDLLSSVRTPKAATTSYTTHQTGPDSLTVAVSDRRPPLWDKQAYAQS